MRQRLLKQISAAALAATLAFAWTQVPASARDGRESQDKQEQSQQKASDQASAHAKRIEGVWEAQATLRVCQTGAPLATFRAMSMFIRGGSLLDTNAAPPATRGPGFGRWEYLGERSYRAVFRFFRYNPDGSFAGVTRVTRNITLGEGGDEFTGTGGAEVFDANDNLIATGCNTETARRVE
jgi:hypothetical protein